MFGIYCENRFKQHVFLAGDFFLFVPFIFIFMSVLWWPAPACGGQADAAAKREATVNLTPSRIGKRKLGPAAGWWWW